MKKLLQSIGWDLEDLNDTIKAVEAAPEKYQIPGIEMDKRKRFISEMQLQLDGMQRELADGAAKIASGKRAALIGRGGAASRYDKLELNIRSENDGFIENQAQAQDLIMREQDSQLDEVGATIGVLKEMGQMIGNELDEQQELLEELDDSMESTTAKLKRTIDKVDKALAITKDGKQSCTICILIIVVIVLLAVVGAP